MESKGLAWAFISLSLLPILGCAGFQSPQPGADYGAYPSNYVDIVHEYFNQILKDPESARYRFDQPERGYMNHSLIYGGDVAWHGYLVKVDVNAKNSFGGYVGYTPYIVKIRDGKVIGIHNLDKVEATYGTEMPPRLHSLVDRMK